MIDRIITASIRHRAWSLLAALLLGGFGLWAVNHTPVDAIPDLSEDAVLVYAEWPGHSPTEVEDQITYPLAVELRGIKGVRVLRSSSDFNFSLIHLILDESTTIAEGRARVAERLANGRAKLPDGVGARLGPDSPATGQIYWYTVEGKGYDLGRLRSIQDGFVGPQLASVPGVAEVASVGGAPIEFEIAVDPARLRLHGVTAGAVLEAAARSNSTVGGHAIQKGNAEYIVRGIGALGRPSPGSSEADLSSIVDDLLVVPLPRSGGQGSVLVRDVAGVAIVPGTRRGVLEKDGAEVVGGVVLIANGENPLEVTKRIKDRIKTIAPGLPSRVSIVPFYDRTPLIEGAVANVRNSVIEAMITASVCVLVVLLHFRTSLVIVLTLPLTVLGSFAIMSILRMFGVADIQANVMSLAGIAISVGILVDSSVVMAENALHRLSRHFGDEPAKGDIRPIVLSACLEVGRPIFFSVIIMLLSFLPVFALRGIEGKLFRPLAFTKTFALIMIAGLTITVVPALCTIFIRGRLRREDQNPLIRGVIEVYRPTLGYFLDSPGLLVWFTSATMLIGLAPIGNRTLHLCILSATILAAWTLGKTWRGRVAATATLLLIALAAESRMSPIGREFLTPLDEQMVMDMPITVPRASVTQSADDLKARDMVLCRFPEVDMVVGKAGRAETPTDPAPMDMIETMVNFRPREYWPRRSLIRSDARRLLAQGLNLLIAERLLDDPDDRDRLVEDVLERILPRFEASLREYAYLANVQLLRDNSLSFGHSSHEGPTPAQADIWRRHVRSLDADLRRRGAEVLAGLAVEELIAAGPTADRDLKAAVVRILDYRSKAGSGGVPRSHHGGMARTPGPPPVPPVPRLESIQSELTNRFHESIILWRKQHDELLGPGGELDSAVQMPGWTNIWTMPIQNRIDMLSTGVNTAIGVRVLGKDLDSVVSASEAIAAVLKTIPGAVDVVADPVRGKGHLEVRVDREKAAVLGVSVGDVNDAVELALGGKVATTALLGRDHHAVRVRYARAFREDEESARAVLVPTLARDADGRPRFVSVEDVADVRIVEGPATIKGEDGMVRNYVRCNIKDASILDFVENAKRVVDSRVSLPTGVTIDWTGRFEHESRARSTLLVVVPLVIACIFAVLYWTYRDVSDAVLMLLAVPGSIAGGVFAQWLSGHPFTVNVWVGYIACFGMATSTGIIMLVYLREAVSRAEEQDQRGLGPESLRDAVLRGACQRLRPKLLTEGTTILGLAPLLWAEGPGSEMIRPMVVPVFGGLLVADEFIDLLLPVLFYRVRLARLKSEAG